MLPNLLEKFYYPKNTPSYTAEVLKASKSELQCNNLTELRLSDAQSAASRDRFYQVKQMR